MQLTARHPMVLHHSRTLLLVALSLAVLPFSIVIVLLAHLLRALNLSHSPKVITATRNGHQIRVLITGVGMAKGLFLCRAFYLGGCSIVAADFQKHANVPCGRFSRAVSRYYSLCHPEDIGTETYVAEIAQIVKAEKIDLCVTCSGVSTAMADAKLTEAIEKGIECKVLQFNAEVVQIMDNKLEFMKQTSQLQLPNPVFYSLNSREDIAKTVLSVTSDDSAREEKITYIVKNVGVDDASRGAIPILDPTRETEMLAILSSLNYDEENTWILQEYLPGHEEYCTHALVIRGVVKAFLACPSASVLLHYRPLPPTSLKYLEMLNFTKKYAQGLQDKHGDVSGHLSFDFLAHNGQLKPIECNPRCHTATVLFRGCETELVKAYLNLLDDQVPSDTILQIGDTSSAYYWMAHDLVVLTILPLLKLNPLTHLKSLKDTLRQQLESAKHFLTWKDPTFEWWDPMPWFALYHLYWPLDLLNAGMDATRWKQLNVSTTKVFKY